MDLDWSKPLVVPVHNLGAGGNTPSFWEPPPRGLGWRHAMFNAFFLREGHRASMIHKSIVAWVDSGGFLFLEAPQRRLAGLHGSRSRKTRGYEWSEDLVELVLKRQEGFGASVAFTLDYPLPPRSQLDPHCCPGEVAERIMLSARGAAVAYQLRRRKSMKLFVVLQYNSIKALEFFLESLRAELRTRAGIGLGEVEGYAVGGLVPHSQRWWLVVLRLQEARRLLGWTTWIHLLGVSSPHNIALFYAAGADSMDSKTYIIAAAKRLYYQPPGAKPARIDLRRARGVLKCGCPACRKAKTYQGIRSDTKLLALHNLYATLLAATIAREMCSQNKLHAYLAKLAVQNPKMRRAIVEIQKLRPCSQKL